MLGVNCDKKCRDIVKRFCSIIIIIIIRVPKSDMNVLCKLLVAGGGGNHLLIVELEMGARDALLS